MSLVCDRLALSLSSVLFCADTAASYDGFLVTGCGAATVLLDFGLSVTAAVLDGLVAFLFFCALLLELSRLTLGDGFGILLTILFLGTNL